MVWDIFYVLQWYNVFEIRTKVVLIKKTYGKTHEIYVIYHIIYVSLVPCPMLIFRSRKDARQKCFEIFPNDSAAIYGVPYRE